MHSSILFPSFVMYWKHLIFFVGRACDFACTLSINPDTLTVHISYGQNLSAHSLSSNYKHGLVLNLAFRINYSVHFLMDLWNCFSCCNINCLAKTYYRFIFNHWRVSKLYSPPSLEKEQCKQSGERKAITDPMIVISKEGWRRCQQICEFVPGASCTHKHTYLFFSPSGHCGTKSTKIKTQVAAIPSLLFVFFMLLGACLLCTDWDSLHLMATFLFFITLFLIHCLYLRVKRGEWQVGKLKTSQLHMCLGPVGHLIIANVYNQ